MPKQRTYKVKRKIKRKSKSSLGIYIFAGIITTLIVWYLIRQPIPEPKDTTSTASEKVSELKDKPKVTAKKKTKDKSTRKQRKEIAKQSKPSSSAKSQVAKPEVVKQPEAIPSIELDDAIKIAIEKLGVPKSYYKRRKAKDQIVYSIPIDRSVMDLVYANMIFKGELERNGGIFLKGTDSSGKQSLSFSSKHNANKYILNIYYDKKLYSQKTNPKTITIVVDDFGAIGGDLLAGFLALDKEVCFAIFPDEQHSVATMQRSKAQGRETLIHVPMEPIGYPKVNPGSNAIFVQYSADKIDNLLSRFIKQLPDCEGINNHMGSLATTDEDVMRSVMATLKKHDMFFLDSRTSNVSVGYSIAQKAHIRSFKNDIFLDSPNISQSTLDERLNQILEMSVSKNNIIAITHCHNKEKLDYLKRFIIKLKAAGFVLVPISKVGHYNVPELM